MHQLVARYFQKGKRERRPHSKKEGWRDRYGCKEHWRRTMSDTRASSSKGRTRGRSTRTSRWKKRKGWPARDTKSRDGH